MPVNRTVPRRPIGTVPKKDFADGPQNFIGTKIGLITRVDEINMKADVKILTGAGFRYELDLTQSMAGPRSFWGGIPEVNSLVILGYRRVHKNLQEAVILTYLPTGTKSGLRFDPFSQYDPNNVDPDELELVEQLLGKAVRYKRLMMKPGDVGGMSSSGSELVLSKDVSFCNRAGDFVELRDSERTLVAQSVHRIEAESGVRRVSGPIRRSAFYLPEDIFDADGKLKSASATAVKDRYYGQDELEKMGPGLQAGEPPKYANSDGTVSEIFNDFTNYPPTTYSNGRKVHYVPTSPGQGIDDIGATADAFVEHRMEMSQTSDLSQEVLEEIDGFRLDQRLPYIEQVLGTVVGNDMLTSLGMRQYADILKPRIFDEFNSIQRGRFRLERCLRSPTNDLEAYTKAGAYLFRLRIPRGRGTEYFAAAVSKQGKLFLNVPAPATEDYASGVKNVSAEINMGGALKAHFGAARPDGVSIHATMDGGIKAVIGHDSRGRALDITYRSSVKSTYEANNPDDNGVAYEMLCKGARRTNVTGTDQDFVGARQSVVDGGDKLQCDRRMVNAHSGYTLNAGEMNTLIAGKSQYNYALQVLENIIAGGRISTILAGGLVQNVAAGGMSYNVGAGGITMTVQAGGIVGNVTAGGVSFTTAAGAVNLATASGAVSIGAGAGAISLTASLALNLTGALIVASAAQVKLGAPIAVLGVCRGTPTMPPNMPTLDPITNIPLQGSVQVWST
jgi:hypothetical protein